MHTNVNVCLTIQSSLLQTKTTQAKRNGPTTLVKATTKMSISTSFADFDKELDLHQEETLQHAGEQDVLFGRGGKSYSHPGNRLFRRLISHHKDLYESMKKPQHRQFLALSIVEAMRRSGARFLRKERCSAKSTKEAWKIVGDKEACIKTSQALRDANVRTKKSSEVKRDDGSIQGNFIPDENHKGTSAERNVVSPCYSGNVETITHVVPQVYAASVAARAEEDLDDIDHIDLETIHTLVRSLGGNHRSQQKESQLEPTPLASYSRPLNQPSSSSRLSNRRPSQQATSRSSFLVLDWLAKEATAERELPPAVLKPSHQTFRQEYRQTTSRGSVSSLSMLEAGLFSADFDFDDFEIDTDNSAFAV